MIRVAGDGRGAQGKAAAHGGLAAVLAALLLRAAGGAKPPAIFVFGDSLSDVGNNNYLPFGFRYDFPHNGVDFPGGVPTGRFSNGYNLVDVVARHMGFRQSPPAYLSLGQGETPPEGVNFASGGSGHLAGWCRIKILDGRDLIIKACLPMAEQMEFFRGIRGSLPADLVSNSVFFFTAGSNDIIYFYLAHLLDADELVDEYVANATAAYRRLLEELYGLGARKFALVNVPAVGSTPVPAALSAMEITCSRDRLNAYSRKFNGALSSMMESLASASDGLKYAIADAYAGLLEVIGHPQAYGMKNVTGACCGGFSLGIKWPPLQLSFCGPAAPYCSDRREYLFWDLIHPTQAACELAGKMFYEGASPFVAPINFKQLVGMDSSERGGEDAMTEIV